MKQKKSRDTTHARKQWIERTPLYRKQMERSDASFAFARRIPLYRKQMERSDASFAFVRRTPLYRKQMERSDASFAFARRIPLYRKQMERSDASFAFARRIPLYLLGIALMAAGITLLNKSNLGTTPLSSIPYVLSKVLADHPFFTFGRLTLLFHTVCILLQVIVCKRPTVQMALQFPLAIAFSALLDLFMSLVQAAAPALWLRALLCGGGIALSALGIVLIVRAELMLPAPDALLHAISKRTGRPLSRVKIVGDITWVAIAALLSAWHLLSTGTSGFLPVLTGCFGGGLAIGIGTLCAMYFTGRLVGVFKKLPVFAGK